MPNLYVDLTTLKSAGFANVSGTTHDTRLRLLGEAVSRACDDYVQRALHSRIETLYFSGNGKSQLILPDDLISVTTLKEDENLDGTSYETTWASTDYVLVPYNAGPTGADPNRAEPYTTIEVDRRNQGIMGAFGKGQRRFELAGKWGYSESTRDSGNLLNDSGFTATQTNVIFDGSGETMAPGMTIIIDSEQMYVTAGIVTPLTVERGVNGTTAATHSNNATISIVQYPVGVREAVLIETARLFTMKSTGFASSVGDAETGQVQVFGSKLHPRARTFLDPFRRFDF